MKALFISYNMTLTERVEGLLDHYTVRGFTLFPLTHGRGSFDGEPHMGTHTWPAMNSTIIAMVEDEKMPRVMEALRKLEKLGVKLSVIARGISIGDELEYTDEVTLGRSIVNRTPFSGTA